jgi:quercetin dioxygenase-like cupin family protein
MPPNQDTESVRGAVLSAPDTQSAVWFVGALVQMRITGAETGGQFAVLEHTGRRGYSTPLHVHAAADELFVVIEGQLKFVSDGEEFAAGPGASVWLPRGTHHAVMGTSDEFRYLNFHYPAGFEDFVREIGTPAPELAVPPPQGPPSPELMKALTESAGRHGMTILGPPPQP